MMAGPAPHAGKNATPRPANKRGAARLAAVQALYQMDVADVPLMEVVAEYENFRLGRELDGEQYVEADPGWFRSIVSGVVARQRDIDPTIHAALPADWPLARLEILLRAILRAGTFELQGRSDVPARVIISEYVDVAKAFFDGDEPGMVNGVLDRVARGQRGAEFEGLPARPDGKAREGAEDDGNQEKAG